MVADPRAYPWPRPAGTFRLDPGTGEARPLEPAELPGLVAGRVPLLAAGSNASPARLARKLAEVDALGPLAVVAVEVADHDAVYAARQASYGAVPATLRLAPRTRLRTHAAFVDARQRAAIDASEGVDGGVYEVVTLDPALVRPVDVEVAVPGPVLGYRATAGALCIDGAPRALAALVAEGRGWPAWTEDEVLSWIATELGVTVHEVVHGGSRRPIADLLRSHACG